MALISEKDLAKFLNITNRQLRQLVVVEGALEGPTLQSDGTLKYDTTDTNIAAALAKTPRERRADGIPSANEHVDEIAARVGRATE